MTYFILENDSFEVLTKRCNLGVEVRKNIEIFKMRAAMKSKELVYSTDRP